MSQHSGEGGKPESDDFMQLFQEAGLEGIAKDVGILNGGRGSAPKRPMMDRPPDRHMVEPHHPQFKKPRSSEKGKVLGLRDFSLLVCRKVQEKGNTTHTCVADELVQEMLHPADGQPPVQYDEKNIRRRVYDALNVLMAMGIISKDKKNLSWQGLPSNPFNELDALARKKQEQKRNIEKKREQLQELLLQQIAFKNLIQRNLDKEEEEKQHENTGEESEMHTKIPLPFIVVSTSSSTIIQCEMSEDRSDVFFNFSAAFEIKDDNEILKRLEMHHTDPEKLPSLIPDHLVSYLSMEPGASGKAPPFTNYIRKKDSTTKKPPAHQTKGNAAGGGDVKPASPPVPPEQQDS